MILASSGPIVIGVAVLGAIVLLAIVLRMEDRDQTAQERESEQEPG